ncbi:MAG: chemotaxis response regulator protein-glutamate methylesterase [Desulfovibrio sp.]|nr:MAG: chemotaxis response regulator protein-glutamate methylesterase [Desulfovibrio sp.]
MRVAIVNDLAMAVEVLKRVLQSGKDLELAWVAKDGKEAVDKCVQDTPDLILMDLIMPVMDGVESTRLIMDKAPCPILVVTATVEGNAGMVFEAMGYGALDAVCTPVMGTAGDVSGGQELLDKMETIAMLIGKSNGEASTMEPPPLIAVGCSTGGPKALADIFACFDADFPGAIVVVQHVDKRFADGLAQWLDGQTKLKVAVAAEGDTPRAGTALVAASNDHLIMTPKLTLTYTSDPEDTPYRPSVDIFFKSVAAVWKGDCIAALLTGMGRDGAEGLLELKQLGCPTVCQDEETSVVFGMPKAAVELGAAEKVLPIDAIGPIIQAFATNNANRRNAA